MAMNTDDVLALAWLRTQLANGTARRLRDQAGLRGTEVAEAAGVSCATLQRWEAGHQSPRGEPALRYAQLLSRLAQRADDGGRVPCDVSP